MPIQPGGGFFAVLLSRVVPPFTSSSTNTTYTYPALYALEVRLVIADACDVAGRPVCQSGPPPKPSSKLEATFGEALAGGVRTPDAEAAKALPFGGRAPPSLPVILGDIVRREFSLPEHHCWTPARSNYYVPSYM